MSQTPTTPELSPTARVARRAEEKLLGRVPPHSVEAEQAVLAGMLVRPEIISSMAEKLEAKDFYLPSHAVLFRAFLDMNEKNAPVELRSVAQELADTKKLEQAGGMEYLAQLTNSVLFAANAEFYADIVREKSMQRRLIDTCSGIINRS